MIIAAFAGTGKSYFCEKHKGHAIDFISMPFKYENFFEVSEGLAQEEPIKASDELILRPFWEFDYFEAVTEMEERFPELFIVIPSVAAVMDMLELDGVKYTLVYPDRELCEQYRERYKMRGDSERFIDIFAGRWDSWMDGLEKSGCGNKIILKAGEYLDDVIHVGGSHKDGLVSEARERMRQLWEEAKPWEERMDELMRAISEK